MSIRDPVPLLDRELSWLAFNHRVLQEAMDPSVPLFDRLGFLAIFSSNLDEFFRVRVASLRSRVRARSGERAKQGLTPAELLRRIHLLTVEHQEQFGATFREQIVPELARQGIHLVDDAGVREAHREELRRIFREQIAPHLAPALLTPGAIPFLRNRVIYLVAELFTGEDGAPPAYGLVEIPSSRVPRFVSLRADAGESVVLFLDDVIRLHLEELFPGYQVGAAHAVKLSRDAELYLEEELAPSVAEAVRQSLGKRETGLPTRFLFDKDAPERMTTFLKGYFGLAEADLVTGGRYHNLHDLHSFPRCDRADLEAPPLEALRLPELDGRPLLEAIREKDRILHFPYHSYDYVLRFLQEAAADPRVEEVWITLYRVAPESVVVGALVDAARNGKRVTAFVEVQARFDEAANLAWAERLEAAGVRTIYSLPGLKVHAKMILVVRREGGAPARFACLSTGNFNERTARVYADHALLTAHPELTGEVSDLFRFLAEEVPAPELRHLLSAPFSLRAGLVRLLEREAEHVREGRRGRVTLKMNSLEDTGMIEALYDASQAGVEIDLIIRGICCLAPGVPGVSERIRARSIVDRFLEHARVFVFHDGGRERCYLASADWMVRNLSHRVEVAFPILDEDVRRELLTIVRLQLEDDCKARILDAGMRNQYLSDPGAGRHRAQLEIYRWLRSRGGSGEIVDAERSPASIPFR